MAAPGILFYGDPHGEWEPLRRAVTARQPAVVVVLGDLDLEVPLRRQLGFLFERNIRVAWIHGNHDVKTEAAYDGLFLDWPAGNLHARVLPLAGHRVAGLGGIFKGRAWFPRHGDEPARLSSRADLLATVPIQEHWRGDLPRHLRDTILPEDPARLRGAAADILVTHEAPTSHPHGFGAIDDLARDLGASLVVHGHQHQSYTGITRDGIPVRGLGRAEAWWGPHPTA